MEKPSYLDFPYQYIDKWRVPWRVEIRLFVLTKESGVAIGKRIFCKSRIKTRLADKK